MIMKRTALNEEHKRLGAKMVEFASWEMPLFYEGVIAEHKTVRESVGVFDVSHMGEIEIKGPQALDFVQFLVTNDVDVPQEKVVYSPMCYENGGTVDDLLVYRLKDKFLLVVNASNVEKDFDWILKNSKGFEVKVENKSYDLGLLAIQGPNSQEVLETLLKIDLSKLGYYQALEIDSEVISRTGYTGEDGFEVMGGPELIKELWGNLMREGVKPIGLGARDTLRFEAGYLLYGNELSEKITPVEAGLGWTVKDKKQYNGKEVLLRQKRGGVERKIVGFKMTKPSVPRHGYKIFSGSEEVGAVTSGMKSPTLNEYLGMGYVSANVSEEIEVEIRGKLLKAKIVKLPFYRGSVKLRSKR
jgi:aminomethyltransferase